MIIQNLNENMKLDEAGNHPVFNSLAGLATAFFKFLHANKLSAVELKPIVAKDILRLEQIKNIQPSNIIETIPILCEDTVLKTFVAPLPVPVKKFWGDKKQHYEEVLINLQKAGVTLSGVSGDFMGILENPKSEAKLQREGNFYLFKFREGLTAGKVYDFFTTLESKYNINFSNTFTIAELYDFYYGGCEKYDAEWDNSCYDEVKRRQQGLYKILTSCTNEKKLQYQAAYIQSLQKMASQK